MQIWFIGRTLASQAGKAGSIPVICFSPFIRRKPLIFQESRACGFLSAGLFSASRFRSFPAGSVFCRPLSVFAHKLCFLQATCGFCQQSLSSFSGRLRSRNGTCPRNQNHLRSAHVDLAHPHSLQSRLMGLWGDSGTAHAVHRYVCLREIDRKSVV